MTTLLSYAASLASGAILGALLCYTDPLLEAGRGSILFGLFVLAAVLGCVGEVTWRVRTGRQ